MELSHNMKITLQCYKAVIELISYTSHYRAFNTLHDLESGGECGANEKITKLIIPIKERRSQRKELVIVN